MSQPSVVVSHLGKCYRVHPDARSRLVELVTFGAVKRHVEKWALKDIDFELWPGQALGVVGVNGAGKSTLLKVLTGTSRQTVGTYRLEGSVSSMLELGAGFHPEFSGRQNIYMNAAVQGITKKQVDARYDEIAEFSELGPALERPVRTYSSGMAMRLGFAASMLVDPDILILDEVLAVGDAHFQKKCMDKFAEFRSREKTILFVSHSVYHVREICDRAIWIHDGRVVMDGDPVDVTDEYEARLLEMRAPRQESSADEVHADGLTRIDDVELVDARQGPRMATLATGEAMRIRVTITHPRAGERVNPLIAVLRNDGLLVLSMRPEAPFVARRGAQSFVLDVPRLPLLAGEYVISAYVADASGAHLMDQALNCVRFKVTTDRMEKGVVLTDYAWRSEDVASPR